MGCSLRWAGADGTPQGNGPKDLLRFPDSLSFFCAEISPVGWGPCDSAGKSDCCRLRWRARLACLWEGYGRNAARLSHCSVEVRRRPQPPAAEASCFGLCSQGDWPQGSLGSDRACGSWARVQAELHLCRAPPGSRQVKARAGFFTSPGDGSL